MPITTKVRVAPVDLHVAARLRSFRKLRRMTQEQLAHEMGVSFQQLQKYETGANRISAGKLFAAAHALDVAPDAFFDGLAAPRQPTVSAAMTAFFAEDGALQIAEAYPKLSARDRQIITDLIGSMVS